MNKLISLIFFAIIFFSFITTAEREIQLLCLTDGQSVEFSRCNQAINDRLCESSNCNLCVTFDTETGVYCPASINVCNDIQDLSCSSLTENEEEQIDQEETINNELIEDDFVADIAYIIVDSSGIDSFLISVLDESSYSYEIIQEPEVLSTDFSNYRMILVGDQFKRFNNPARIPIDRTNSLIFNIKHYEDFGWSSRITSISSPARLKVDSLSSSIVEGVSREFNAYRISNINVKAYSLSGSTAQRLNRIVSSQSSNNAVIATILPGDRYRNNKIAQGRGLFFGIVHTNQWTAESQELFLNSILWVIRGEDLDNDGFFPDIDCNNQNRNINPSAREIANDNIDQNCDGEDLKINRAPIINEFSCEANILEDQPYECTITASDPDLDNINFRIDSESGLNCRFEENKLIYRSLENFNGNARCNIIAEDSKGGSSSKVFRVSITSVNDLPKISLVSPETQRITLPPGINRVFSVQVEDPDNDAIVNWYLNGFFTTSGNSYTFSSQDGTHIIEAIVSDNVFTDSTFWIVNIDESAELSCAELGGFNCADASFCTGEILETSTGICCNIQCNRNKISNFEDADACERITNDIQIEIRSPKIEDEFEFGDKVRTEIRLTNNLEEEETFNVKLHLYDLDKDESIQNVKENIKIEGKRQKTARLDITLDEVDLEHKYALFVKAEEGSICNQAQYNLNIQRKEEHVVISKFETPSNAVCGEFIESIVTLENLGTNSEDVSINVLNRQLEIEESTEEFELEEYSGDNRESKRFLWKIPTGISTSDYNIKLDINGLDNRLSQTKTIHVSCIDGPITEITNTAENLADTNSITLGEILSESYTLKKTFENRWIVFLIMLLTTFIAVAFLLIFVVFNQRVN